MEKMILILNVFNHNAKRRTKKRERDLQLAEEGGEQSWKSVFLSNVQLWVHWDSGDQETCGYRERFYSLKGCKQKTPPAHVDIKKQNKTKLTIRIVSNYNKNHLKIEKAVEISGKRWYRTL